MLPVVCGIWASARIVQLEPWFRSWVPDSLFSAGGGRSSVESWFSNALDIEECLVGAVDADVHLFVTDVVETFDTVDSVNRTPSHVTFSRVSQHTSVTLAQGVLRARHPRIIRVVLLS